MLTILYLVSVVFLMCITVNKNWCQYRVYIKGLTSFLFVLLYLKNDFNLVVLAAFIFCFLGDVLLGININGIKKYMIYGLVSFLLGHVFYLSYFFNYSRFMLNDITFSIIGLIVLKLITKKLDIHFGKKRYAIWLYTVVVFLMGSKAFDVLLVEQNLFGLFIGLGGILFVLSDFILVFLYFKYKGDLRLQLSNTVIYYLAQFLIAQAFIFR